MHRALSLAGGVLLLMAMVGVPANQARAVPVIFDFDVTFTDGPLTTQTFPGTFSIEGDHFARAGIEDFSPDFPNTGTGELLSFSITIDGNLFAMEDDAGFPIFPIIGFEDGTISFFDYVSTLPDPSLSIFGFDVDYFDADSILSSGFVSSVVERTAVSVSEPAALGLLASALLILFAAVRRRRRRA